MEFRHSSQNYVPTGNENMFFCRVFRNDNTGLARHLREKGMARPHLTQARGGRPAEAAPAQAAFDSAMPFRAYSRRPSRHHGAWWPAGRSGRASRRCRSPARWCRAWATAMDLVTDANGHTNSGDAAQRKGRHQDREGKMHAAVRVAPGRRCQLSPNWR